MDASVWVVLGIVVGAGELTLCAAGFALWRIYSSDERALARRIGRLRFANKLRLGLALFRDRRIPVALRIAAVALVLYVAMPLDLIPDFIPVIGYLDDVLIVMIGAGLLLRSIPRYIIEEHVGRYEEERVEVGSRKSEVGGRK